MTFVYMFGSVVLRGVVIVNTNGTGLALKVAVATVVTPCLVTLKVTM